MLPLGFFVGYLIDYLSFVLKIVDAGNRTQIERFMRQFTDKTMMSALTAKVIEALNIDVGQMPAKNIPEAYVSWTKSWAFLPLVPLTEVDEFIWVSLGF